MSIQTILPFILFTFRHFVFYNRVNPLESSMQSCQRPFFLIFIPSFSPFREVFMSFKPNGELTPQGGGDAIPLLREHLSIGRRESCDIPMRFANVSGLHAELSFKDGYWKIRDLNSTNGIK